jgi:predicted amidohydrolase
MRIALGQLDCRVGDRISNEKRLVATIAEARHAGADLLVVPELQLSGYGFAAAEDTSCTVEELARVLAGSRLATLVGFHERAGEESHNSAGYFEDGTPVHVHRKLYLCDYAPFDEDVRFIPGHGMRAFDTAFARMATLICNDAWQPFLPSLAVHDGAEVVLIPAASSTAVPEAEAYWSELTRFYARMLGCYVVFVNRVGTEDGGLTFWGGSHVIDPRGDVVAQSPRLQESLVLAEIDLKRVAERRRQLPLAGLRPELLRNELERLGTAGVR